MKFHHAAALALLGWYLMLPRALWVNGKLVIQDRAPLSTWYNKASFDTARECREFLYAVKQVGSQHVTKDPEVIAAWKEGMAAGQCIASDDPRLKEHK
jgi:hypothetical protein